MLAVRYVYLLALVVWLGGMVLLGAIVAPTVFQVLPASDPTLGRVLAGEVFGTMLARFQYVAYASGAVLLLCLGLSALLGPRPHGFAVRVVVVAAMLGVSLYSGTVLHRVERIRDTVGTPSRLSATDLRRVEFDRLHARSTRLMMLNIAGALILLFWEARDTAS